MLGYMKIVSKVAILKTDMKESEVVTYLMVDFPPISKQDPLEFLAAYVLHHYQDTGDVITYSQIAPTRSNAPLKISRKRITKDQFDEEDVEEKPIKKAKKAKKDKVSEPVAPKIQEEVADLEPVKVLEKRTRGGSSEAASQPKKKVRKQVKRTLRKLVESKYTEEEDVQAEEASTLVTKMVKSKQVAEKNLEMSSNPQAKIPYVSAESLQNLDTQDSIDADTLQKANELARELGSSVVHIVKNKVVEAAKKVVCNTPFSQHKNFSNNNQSIHNLNGMLHFSKIRNGINNNLSFKISQ